MIPEGLLPLFTALRLNGIPVCIAGGYAADPTKASDIDVWVTIPNKLNEHDLAALLSGAGQVLAWTYVQDNPHGNKVLCYAKSDPVTIEGVPLPVEIMLTKYQPYELIQHFDISTHAIAVTGAAVYKATFWTPTTEPPVVNENCLESSGYGGRHMKRGTKERLTAFRERYGHQSLWKKALGAFAMILLAANVAQAQPGALAQATSDGPGIVAFIDSMTPAPQSPVVQSAARATSWATYGGAMALDVATTPRTTRDYALLGTRLATTGISVWAVKKLVHRARPCAPADCGAEKPNTSFLSGHAAFAFQAINFSGGHAGLGVTLAVTTAAGRIIGNRHWLTDTLGGAGLGLLTGRIR